MINIFVDSNILLDFYRLSNNDLEELKKLEDLVKKNQITLWMTQQVKDEFYRNRESNIRISIDSLKKHMNKESMPNMVKSYNEEYKRYCDIKKEYRSIMTKLIKRVEKDIVDASFQADGLIERFFENSKCFDVDDELYDKSIRRVYKGNPPGKNGSFGDAINWESLLKYVPNKENLYLISNDKDFSSELNKKYIRPFLEHEWRTRKGSRVILCTSLGEFFEDENLDIKLSDNLEMRHKVGRLINSNCFADTHSAIRSLSKVISDLDQEMLELIIDAGLNNDQINWILSDEDVYEFYSKILEQPIISLENENVINLKDQLNSVDD
ncbi:PIN domain-containing protein [Thiotrichales bacterium 19X7-9]|nr:PIN domain-containing protein [Thiotrichales bacterium 19X7-9]